jgi:ribosomal protein S18 acetylase RimI-like enzyme
VIVVRPASLPRDAAAIGVIDTAFSTTAVYDVAVADEAIRLTLRQLDPPLTKRFPLDDLESPERPYDHAWAAWYGERCVGFAASSYEAWNRRLTLWHLYVDPSQRRRGVARQLLRSVEAHGRAHGARHLWLETSSLNAPGIEAYRALGFALTGADLTLYDGTPAEGETALFFSRPLD